MQYSASSGQAFVAPTDPGHRTEPRDEACAPRCRSFRPVSVEHGRTSPAALSSIAPRDAHAGSGGERGCSRSIRRRIFSNSTRGTATSAS